VQEVLGYFDGPQMFLKAKKRKGFGARQEQ
jgi:hypothetical protein